MLYFKVLKILGLLTDSVRDSVRRLDNISGKIWHELDTDAWFERTYVYAKESQQIVEYNWEVVKKQKNESAERILSKLDRSTNEVKSVMSGVSQTFAHG